MPEHTITISEFCSYHHIEPQFIDALQQYGLIELVQENERQYIDESQLPHLERMMHLHYDLDINFEGIDAINHLLNKLEKAEEELMRLRNSLRFYAE